MTKQGFKISLSLLLSILISFNLIFALTPSFALATPNNNTTNTSKNTNIASNKSDKKTADEPDKEEVKKAQEAVDRMRSISKKLEVLYEDLNTATEKMDSLNKRIEEINRKIEANQTSLERAQKNLNNWINITYKDGPLRYLSVLLGSSDFEDFVSRIIYLDYINGNEKDLIDNISYYKTELEDEQTELEKSYEEIHQYEKIKSNNAGAILTTLEEQMQYFNSLDEKARKAVLADDGIVGSGLLVFGVSGIHSSEGAHPEVAEYALNFLGTPYVWGGDSPSGFDCSGFTMYVYYHAIGKSLAHFARTQFSQGVIVSKDSLCPGDLVFFGGSVESIHHVGIYMGNDKYIHAPTTGDVVKISTLSSRADYIGACRP